MHFNIIIKIIVKIIIKKFQFVSVSIDFLSNELCAVLYVYIKGNNELSPESH